MEFRLLLYRFFFSFNLFSSFLPKKKTNKIFCIGFNKTGTTSLEHVLKEFSITMGGQGKGVRLCEGWPKCDYSKLIEFCKTSEGFRDAPFSFPETYKILDSAFPNSKFILTVRDNPDQWYNSITNFHKKIWGEGRRLPSKEDLINAKSNFKPSAYDIIKSIYKVDDDDLYNKEALTSNYINHIKDVKKYFENRPHDLILINLSRDVDYYRLCCFLGQKPKRNKFPRLNQT